MAKKINEHVNNKNSYKLSYPALYSFNHISYPRTPTIYDTILFVNFAVGRVTCLITLTL